MPSEPGEGTTAYTPQSIPRVCGMLNVENTVPGPPSFVVLINTGTAPRGCVPGVKAANDEPGRAPTFRPMRTMNPSTAGVLPVGGGLAKKIALSSVEVV